VPENEWCGVIVSKHGAVGDFKWYLPPEVMRRGEIESCAAELIRGEASTSRRRC